MHELFMFNAYVLWIEWYFLWRFSRMSMHWKFQKNARFWMQIICNGFPVCGSPEWNCDMCQCRKNKTLPKFNEFYRVTGYCNLQSINFPFRRSLVWWLTNRSQRFESKNFATKRKIRPISCDWKIDEKRKIKPNDDSIPFEQMLFEY